MVDVTSRPAGTAALVWPARWIALLSAAGLARQVARLGGLRDGSVGSVAWRFAGTSYLIRLGNAGIAFLTQILLARWMGTAEFGIYTYVWTWVVLLGAVGGLGLSSSPQRFIPEYRGLGRLDLLRGFLLACRTMATGLGTLAAILGGALLLALRGHVEPWLTMPMALGLACLPAFVLGTVQEGMARAFDWPRLAMTAAYFVRPVVLLAILAGMHALAFESGSTAAMLASLAATWATALWQMVALNRRLAAAVPPGPSRRLDGVWLRASLPIFMVEGFYLLLSYCDVIVLERFVSPAAVGVYFAATKLVSLVAFVYFSVAAAAAHQFAGLHVTGRPDELAAFLRRTIRWTFLPSAALALVILALGHPLLALFGPDFTAGYRPMALMLAGLLARASIGPVERLLSMVGQGGLCAGIYAVAFAGNLGLNLLMVPRWGLDGAAAATSLAIVAESAMLFLAARWRLGLHVFYWGGPRSARQGAHKGAPSVQPAG